MIRSNVDPWTDEQFVTHFTERNVSAQDVESWTCEQLILYTFAESQQPSGAIRTNLKGLKGLLIDPECIEVSEKQHELLVHLQTTAISIPILVNALLIWLLEKDVIAVDRPDKIDRMDALLTAYFAQDNLTIHNLLSWKCKRFVQYIYDRLSEQSTATANILDIFLKGDECEFAYDWPKEILLWMQKDIKFIQIMADKLKIWLSKENAGKEGE